VAKNSLILLTFFFFHQLFILIQLKILTNWLIKEQLGEYFTLLAIAAIISIFIQLGLPLVVTRFIAKYEALSKNLLSKKLILFSWLVVAASGMVLLVLALLFSKGMLNLIYALPPSSDLLIWAIILNMVISFKAITYSAFYGLQKMEFPAIAEVLIAMGITFLLFLFRFQLSIFKVLEINLLVNLVLSVIFSLFLILSFGRKPDGTQEKTPLLNDIKSFWLGATLTSFLSIALNYADQILISMLLSFSSVAIFYLAFRVTYLSRHIISIPLDALSPEITRKWELNLSEELQENLRFFAKMIYILAVFLATLTFGLAQPIIYLIASPDFRESVFLLSLLSLALPAVTVFSPINFFFRAIGKISYSLLADFIWLFGYFTCGFILLKWKGLWGLAVAFILVSLFLAVFNLQRVKEFILWRIERIWDISLCGVVVSLMILVLTKNLPIPNISKLFVGLGVAFFGYSFFLVRGKIISVDDKQRLVNLISSPHLRKLIMFTFTWPLGKNRG
jgi:O-antigen/teichoic acid export membrane protein